MPTAWGRAHRDSEGRKAGEDWADGGVGSKGYVMGVLRAAEVGTERAAGALASSSKGTSRQRTVESHIRSADGGDGRPGGVAGPGGEVH